MKSIQESKKILICIGSNIKLDNYASLYLVAKSLESELSKEVHVACPNNIPTNFTNTLPLGGNIKILNKLPPKKFLLEFKNQKERIKNIQWIQEGDKLNFYINMEKGNFNAQNLESKIIGSDYQSIILIGINNFSELGGLFVESKEIFTNANLVAIGGKAQGEGMNVDLVVDEKHSSISEDTYIFLQKLGLKIDAPQASVLLSGIFDSTKNFKQNIIDPKTYIVCAELIRRGATNEKAQEIIEKVKPTQGQNATENKGVQ